MQVDQSHFERNNQQMLTFFGLYLFRPITRALLPSFGTTSVRIAFISINFVGRLAWWLRRALETRLAALVSGVVRRKNAARVLPPFDGDPGSMIRPGRSWASRLAELNVLSTIKESSVTAPVVGMNFPYFLKWLHENLGASG